VDAEQRGLVSGGAAVSGLLGAGSRPAAERRDAARCGAGADAEG
jgi:hypothetical protein